MPRHPIIKSSLNWFWQNVRNVLPDSNNGSKIKLSNDDGSSILDEKVTQYMNKYNIINIIKKETRQREGNSRQTSQYRLQTRLTCLLVLCSLRVQVAVF